MKPILSVLAIIGVSLTVVASNSSAQERHRYHSWVKQNEVNGTDGYGNKVKVCTYRCSVRYGEEHQTQTQGFGFCPYPG